MPESCFALGRGSFECPYCLKKYTFNTNMIRHKKAVHEGKRYLCRYPQCGFQSTDSTYARAHVIKIHCIAPADARRYLHIKIVGHMVKSVRSDKKQSSNLEVLSVLAQIESQKVAVEDLD